MIINFRKKELKHLSKSKLIDIINSVEHYYALYFNFAFEEFKNRLKPDIDENEYKKLLEEVLEKAEINMQKLIEKIQDD